MKLPRNQEAIVPDRKITDYLLSETHPVGKSKARYFRALGYSEKNAGQLKEALATIATSGDVTESTRSPFGTKYVIDGELITPTGIRARVRTVWILETGENLPRFVTAYPADEEDGGA